MEKVKQRKQIVIKREWIDKSSQKGKRKQTLF
jgi:hypothetical protein